MILGQLRDLIRAEAGLQDIDAFQVWIDQTIQSELNNLTAIMRYPEQRREATINLTAATQTVTIPDAQHIDKEQIYFVPDGDLEIAYRLDTDRDNMLVDVGRVQTIIRTAPTEFSLFPFNEITSTDQIHFIYWAYPTLTDDQSVIPINALVNTLKDRVISRAVLHSNSKLFGAHRQLARESQVMAAGATDYDEV